MVDSHFGQVIWWTRMGLLDGEDGDILPMAHEMSKGKANGRPEKGPAGVYQAGGIYSPT
jgi:hypothetical protein